MHVQSHVYVTVGLRIRYNLNNHVTFPDLNRINCFMTFSISGQDIMNARVKYFDANLLQCVRGYIEVYN